MEVVCLRFAVVLRSQIHLLNLPFGTTEVSNEMVLRTFVVAGNNFI